jgi:chaperonin GroES
MGIATLSETTEITEQDKQVAATWNPRFDRVLAKPIKAPEKTSGGIIMVDTTRERDSLRAVVLAVGPGRILDNGQRVEVDLEQGDVVGYTIFSGSVFHSNKVEYVILRDAECILKKVSKEGGVY